MGRFGRDKYCKINKRGGGKQGTSWTSPAWARMVLEEDKRSETEREAQ